MINSGMLGAVTLVLAATSAHAFPRPPGLSQGNGGTVTTTSSSSSSHSSGSAYCSSAALAASYSSYKDAYAKAVTDVVVSACNDPYWSGDIDVMYKAAIDFAYVFANAYVEAGAACVTRASGDAKVEGCAYAEASDYAWNYAFVDVHAEASAKAITEYCGCSDATAIDWAMGSIAQQLIADAYASVEVTACSSGNDYALAYASVDCYADIFASVLATSFAEALVYSDCYPYYDDAVAATAKITVDSWVYENEQCTFIEYAEGLTLIDTDGSTDTATVGGH